MVMNLHCYEGYIVHCYDNETHCFEERILVLSAHRGADIVLKNASSGQRGGRREMEGGEIRVCPSALKVH
jgi:hypothetical protein